MEWWGNMDLAPWCTDGPVLASLASDMPFAQAIAAERARRRGTRQRVHVRHSPSRQHRVLYVEDAPEVTEPCS